MKSFKELLIEDKKNDIVCRCHTVTRGDLLDLKKFNQNATEQELLDNLKIGKSCGCCKKENCKKIDVHYSKVLK